MDPSCLQLCVTTDCPEGQVLDEESGLCELEQSEVTEQEPEQSEEAEQDEQQAAEDEQPFEEPESKDNSIN